MKPLDLRTPEQKKISKIVAALRKRAEKAEVKQLRSIHAILARLADLLQYDVVARAFFVREIDLFRDEIVGPKLCSGKTLLSVLKEALAANEPVAPSEEGGR